MGSFNKPAAPAEERLTQNEATTQGAIDDTTIYSTERAAAILLAAVGMALQWASLHCVTFFETIVHTNLAAKLEAAWTVNSIITFVVFVLVFFASRQLSSMFSVRGFIPLMCGGLGAGMLCLLLGVYLPSSRILVYLGNVLIALGTTPLIIVWGEMYSYLNPRGEQLFVTLAGIVMSVVIYLVEINLPTAFATAVFFVMPFGSVYALVCARRLFEEESGAWGAKTKKPMQKSPAMFFVCIVVFSVPYSYLRGGVEVQSVLASLPEWSNVLSIVVLMMVAVALAELYAERSGVLLIPSFVLFFLTAAMAVHLFFGNASTLTVPSFLYAGYYHFLAMVYLALGPLVATTNTNPLRLFSSAMIANVGGLLLGSVLVYLEPFVGERSAAIVVMIVTYVIFFAGCTLLYNRSYSIFRVNFYDETTYSFEYLVPIGPLKLHSVTNGGEGVVDGEARTRSLLDAITAQCDVARETYGLSSREHEVLIALTRGRTIASIADDLYVSENTAKAHTKAIYRKMKVHTREELLNRVQDLDIGGL